MAVGRLVLTAGVFWAVALWLVSRFPLVEATGVRLTLHSVQALLSAFGMHPTSSGVTLFVRRTAINISSDCSPHLPYLIFAGAVLATPATWPQRAVGLLAGAAVIHLFNVARILALIGVLVSHKEWFEFAHAYLWQIGTIVVVIAGFVTWSEWTRRPARAA